MFNCIQKTIELPPFSYGSSDITSILENNIPEISKFSVGLMNIFLVTDRSNASITINENFCIEVKNDLTNWLDQAVDEDRQWKHTSEDPTLMPSKIKSSLLDVSINVPITDGMINMGVWQGIYLNEHSYDNEPRKIIVTIKGKEND